MDGWMDDWKYKSGNDIRLLFQVDPSITGQWLINTKKTKTNVKNIEVNLKKEHYASIYKDGNVDENRSHDESLNTVR